MVASAFFGAAPRGNGHIHLFDADAVLGGENVIETLLRHPLLVEKLRPVPEATIAEDGHDGVAGAELLRQLHCRPRRSKEEKEKEKEEEVVVMAAARTSAKRVVLTTSSDL